MTMSNDVRGQRQLMVPASLALFLKKLAHVRCCTGVMDYSKFDNIGDSSDEDEPQRRASKGARQAMPPMSVEQSRQLRALQLLERSSTEKQRGNHAEAERLVREAMHHGGDELRQKMDNFVKVCAHPVPT